MAIICKKGERLTHFQLWDFKRKRHWLFCSHRTFWISVVAPLFFFFYSTFSVPNLPVKRSGCHPEWQPVCMSNCPLCAVVTHTNTLTPYCACWPSYTDSEPCSPAYYTCWPTHTATYCTYTHIMSDVLNWLTRAICSTGWLTLHITVICPLNHKVCLDSP